MKFTDTSWCIVTSDRTSVLTSGDIIRPIVKNQDGTINHQTGRIAFAGSKKYMQDYLIDFCNKNHLSVYDFRVVLIYTTIEDLPNCAGTKSSQKISFKC